jgi:hypothetical protein
MRNITRKNRKTRRRRGISSIIGTIFFVLILIVAFAMFITVFNSFSTYQNAVVQKDQAEIQNQQTQLTSAVQLGSPTVPSGTSNPPVFNLNSIGSSTVQTHYPFERKLVYSQGLWWAFYSSGSAIVYQTSSDGITWSGTSTLTSATGSTVSYGFSVWMGPAGKLYYVLAPYDTSFSTTVTVGLATLSSSGVATSTATTNPPIASGYYAAAYDTITNDTSGNIWVALNIEHSPPKATTYVQVYRCTSTLSTACAAVDGTSPPSITFSSTDDIVPQILGLSNGAVAVLYQTSGGTGQSFTTLEAASIVTCTPGTSNGQCQGSASSITWSSAVTSSSTYYPDETSAVSIGTAVYFAGAGSGAISTWSFTYGASSVSSTTIIDSAVGGTSAPVSISEDGTGNTLGTGNSLAVTYGSGISIYFSTSMTDTSWSSREAISTSETTLFGISSTYSGTQEGAIWSSGSASPYVVRFAELNTQPYNPNQFSPSTVGTSTSPTATGISGEDKLVYDVGLWWDFYSTGAGVDYATSSDGLSWSAPISVTSSTGSTTGSDFAVALNGNTLSWVLSSGGSAASFVWGYGTLTSSGIVTFTTSGAIPTSYTTEPVVSIAVDSGGNTWISLTTLQSGSTYHVEVYEHSSGAAVGTWSSNLAPSTLPSLSATASSMILASGSSPGATLIVETSGSIPSGYNAGTGAIAVYTTSVTSGWSSSTWNSAVSPPSDYALPSSSAVIVGNIVYFAGMASSSVSSGSGTLNLWSYAIGQTSTSSESVIESKTNIWRAALGDYDNTLYLFDANGSSINYYYSGNQGNTWSFGSTGTSYEPDIAGLSAADGSTIAITWTSGNVENYNVRFAALSSVTISNNSPNAVHVVSLYVTNPTTDTLLTYYYTNSTELLDYWIGGGSTQAIVFNFDWTPVTSYAITYATSSGVVETSTLTSPA